MKKIIGFILILTAVGLVVMSCKKIIEKDPKMVISDQTALTTVEGLQTAIIGTYNALQNGDLYGGNIQACQDMLTNNVKPSGEGNIVYEETQMLEKNMSPDNRLSASFWSNAYYVVNMANSIIQAAPGVDMDSSVANPILGECLFIRAMMTFDLLRYIGNPNTGMGVPLLTEPTGIEGKPSRAPIEDCYAQIIADLNQAKALLPESNESRATKWAAYALLARVYFYHGDYALAEEEATVVINSGKFQLDTSLTSNFSPALNSEIIFAMMSTQTNTSCGTLNNYYRKASNGKFSPAPSLIKLFTFTGGTQDRRFTTFFTNIDGKWWTTMFDDRYMNVPLIRLGEVYLTRAESRFNLGNTVGALSDLNQTRRRAGLIDTLTIDPNQIYYERSKELVFQGDNFFNMKRLQKQKISDDQLPWNDVRLMYLIPQREMDVNPNLVQNEP
jgi:hypothetical protein